jgi:heme exporter protein C
MIGYLIVFLIAVSLWGYFKLPEAAQNAVVALLVTAGIVIGLAMPEAALLKTTPIAFFHVPMAISMLLMFCISAGYGIAWLRTKKTKFDGLSLAYAEVGFLGSVIAMTTGMIFAKTNWGAYWSWDPQQVGVLGTMLTYAALFSLRGATDDDIKKRNFWAVYAIFGAIVACFGSVVYRHINPDSTLHPSGTLTESGRLFKFALWFNVFGYALFMIKVSQVRARLENVNTKLKELSWL